MMKKEIQIKTKCDASTHARRLKWKRLTKSNVGENTEQLQTVIHCWCEYKLIQTLWKTVWQQLKLNIYIIHDPAMKMNELTAPSNNLTLSKRSCVQNNIVCMKLKNGHM